MSIAPPPHAPPQEAPQLTGDDTMATNKLLVWRDRLVAWARVYCVGQRGLVIAGSGMALIYLVLTLSFPITSWWYRTDDNLRTIPARTPWGRWLIHLTGTHSLSIWVALFAAAVIVALFGLQGLALF